MPKRRKFILVSAIILLAILFLLLNRATAPGAKVIIPEKNTNNTAKPDPIQPKSQFSLTESNSIWMVVNKKNPLPLSYVPANLRSINGQQLRGDAANQLETLIAAAQTANTPLKAISGYRSSATQTSLYNSYVTQDGQAVADTYSARPGYSEHQTGLAVDMGNSNGACDLEICFGETAGGAWLIAHAHEYGFVIRYLNGKTNITGYQYEPWHIRYVGTELASQLQGSSKTMEEHFSLPAAPNY